METKYTAGQVVFASVNPDILLTVRRYVDRIYYCRIKGSDNEKDLVYFERELEAFTG